MKKIFSTFLTLLINFSLLSDDYQTAQRFKPGDTISAEVLNDILDRIELVLVTPVESDFIGTWQIIQTLSNIRGYGGSNINNISGLGGTVDNLYKQRLDSVTFSDDGDGTYSLSQETNCAFVNSDVGNAPCSLGYAVVGGRFMVFFEGGVHSYELKKISPTRIIMSHHSGASSSYNILILDKEGLPPKAPKNLSVTVSGGNAALSWEQGDDATSNYNVKRKESFDQTFSTISTSSSTEYSDNSIVKGNSYWYRVYATNANGESVGSNVIQAVYLNAPPTMNISSALVVNEGETSLINVQASDADGDDIQYSVISQSPGNDATYFDISSTGDLAFNISPDFENPSDYDVDNIYEITIVAGDGANEISQDLSIVVKDIED